MKECPSCGAEADGAARFCLECGYAFEAAAIEVSDPWQGRMVAGRFRIIEKLGDGGMGEVFRAEQVPMGRAIALKVLRQSLSEDPEQVARFKREAQAASQLSHPNTIIVHDFGQDDDGTLFIAMELLEGRPLDAVLEAEGTLDPGRAARILTQVCASLHEAHERGMVHRDLKPENIFLVDRGAPDFVKVLDFGIAKVTQSSKGERLESITRAGAVFGTPHYMAPEQIRGDELDARADVYALGVVLYRMIAGHLPFDAGTVMEMLTKHLTAEPAPIAKESGRGDPAARARLEAVALRALSKQPDQRQPSALAFVEDLMAALPGVTLNSMTGLVPLAAAGGTGVTVAAPPATLDPATTDAGSGGKGGLIALLVLLLAGGGFAGWWFLGGGGGGGAETPAVLAQQGEGGGDEGGGEAGGDEAGGDEAGEEGGDEAAGGEAAVAAEPEAPPTAEEKAAADKVAAEAEAEAKAAEKEAEAAEKEAAKPLTADEAQKLQKEAEAAAAAAAAEKQAAEQERARREALEQAKAAEVARKAAEAAQMEAEAQKAAAEAARKAAEAEKAAAEQAAAEAQARADAGQAAAAAAVEKARADRAKVAAEAEKARLEAERLRAEIARINAEKARIEQEKAAAEQARTAAEAQIAEAEAKKREAEEKKAAAAKGKRAVGFGRVYVKTKAIGAKVYVDGKLRGKTPMRGIRLAPGRHRIEVRKGAKRMSKTVNVSAGKIRRVGFSL